MKKLAIIYSIIVGLGMLGSWLMFYLTGNIPELAADPIQITFHLIAEVGTAVLLLVSAYLLTANKRSGYSVWLIALGALMYTLIVSPGYFLQQGEMAFPLMFGAIFVLAVWLLISAIRSPEAF